MDLDEARGQKRQRLITNPDGLADKEKNMPETGVAGQQLEDENIGHCDTLLGTGEFVTDDDCEDDDDDR